jgi:hypothetical protein
MTALAARVYQPVRGTAGFRGCRLEGDGKYGGNGRGFAAIRVEGNNIVTIGDCDVWGKDKLIHRS